MNNQNEKNSGSARSAAGLKIVVSLLALCLMGGLMIFAVSRAVENASMAEISYENDNGGTLYEPDLSVSAEIPITDSLTDPDTSDAKQEEEGNSQDSSAGLMPVQGEIVKSYSGDSLLYSETLDQYVCHKAIDIQAPAGSPVCTAGSGTVTETGVDDRYGSYVLISHGSGLESRYCCLADIRVSEGDVLKKGDTVGTVGEDALFEKAEGPHLHFEVIKNGALTNPDITAG